MDTKLKEESPEEEFITIIQLLHNSDLAVLHDILILEDEEEQHKRLRTLRSFITSYPSICNAFSARTLVTNPNYYIANEIVIRYKKQFII